VIEWRLPTHEWPDTPLILTAIDAHTGEFVTWNKTSGVSLVDAVASSCAVPGVWPCVPIAGRMFYDGGLRTSTNAHLAAGHDSVVIIAPLTQGVTPLIEQEIAHLRSQGSIVSFIATDEEAKAAMGVNALDPAFRRASAEHGLRQGLRATVLL
jgi:NTE family protein